MRLDSLQCRPLASFSRTRTLAQALQRCAYGRGYATDVNEGSLTVEEAVEASSAPENIAASCGGRGGCNPIKGARELSNEPGPGRFVPEQPTPRVQTQMDINDVTSGRREP